MGERQTVSRVLLAGTSAESERTLLRRWCEEAASAGGSFSIVQEWHDSQWYATYTINWPAASIGRNGGNGEVGNG